MDNKRPKSRFQSTLPRRERLPATPKLEHFRYFNPRSREGSDYLFCTFTIFFSISIHAPAKGATFCGNWYLTSGKNFNPRSREGSDEGSNAAGKTPDRFQSTLPRRERQRATITKHRIRRISIHAPAKGATRAGGDTSGGDAISIHAPAKGATKHLYGSEISIDNFNPRSREGSDGGIMTNPTVFGLFQSTLPRRERHMYLKNFLEHQDFNPRSREGSDNFSWR